MRFCVVGALSNAFLSLPCLRSYLPYNVESDDLKTSLESLSTIGHVDVQRSDTDENGGHTWSITFQTELGDLPALEVDTLALTGSLPYSEVPSR